MSLFLPLVLFVSAGTLAFGEDTSNKPEATPSQSWADLQKLAPSDVLRVTTSDKQVDGKLHRWSADSIQLMMKRGPQTYSFNDVRRVSVRRPASRWKAALIGGAVGFGIGFAIGAGGAGYIADQNNPSAGTRIEVGAGFGGLIGGVCAGIGAATGGSRYETVYKR